MNLKTISKISDKIAWILELEVILAVLTLFGMILTPTNTDTYLIVNHILRHTLISIPYTAVLYAISTLICYVVCIYKLRTILKYQEQPDKKKENKKMKLTTLGQIPDKIAQILKLECV